MGQMVLLPVNLDEEIEPEHLVRVVHRAVEQMDLRPLYAQYVGGGTSSYHPKMLLKVLLYAYSQQIFSSRQIAKALRENIYFMWLSGNNHPDFHTINRFRGVVLKETISEIFAALLLILEAGGYIQLENYFLDGTKLEANASKYSFVWAKNTQRYKEGVQEKVGVLLEQIERLNTAEDAAYGEADLPERGGGKPLDAAQLEAKIAELNTRLRQLPADEDPLAPPPSTPAADPPDLSSALPTPTDTPRAAAPAKTKHEPRKRRLSKAQQLAKGIRELTETCLPRLKKYEAQAALLGTRNSYSKTDPEATFMRMKDDHMHNGQLKAGYNLQIGTENQFVVGFSVHQRPGDPTCLIPHLEETRLQRGGRQPQNVVADSAYGSEENYAYLDTEGIQAYVKYNTFYQETKARRKPNPFAVENMPYDAAQDTFTCPNGQLLHYKSTFHTHTANGYRSERRLYDGADCSQCSLKAQCTKAEGNRQVQLSLPLRAMRAHAKEMLLSETGAVLRKQRSVDVETVFGRIKQDWGFRRFRLRGLKKVNTEWGLLCIAHNLAKLAVA